MRRPVLLVFLFVVLASTVAASGRAGADTEIELFTMGPTDDIFESFGHGTLCVTNEQYPTGICYNYGTADFSDPVQLIWLFFRGRARFWVSHMPRAFMIQAYIAEDRTIYRQLIALPEDAAARLAAALESDTKAENKYYLYNHYRDNCTTRLRDHLDAVTDGALSRGADVLTGQTWRDVTLDGFAVDVRLLVGMEFLVGRPVDSKITLRDAMFLPDVLRTEVQKRLGAPVEVVNQRSTRLPKAAPLAGRWLVFAGAGLLTIIVALGAILGRPRLWRLVLTIAGLVLGSIGLVAYAVAFTTRITELQRNEVLLVYLPTDLLLLFLGRRALWIYLFARVVLLAAVAIGLAVGLLIQPMGAAFALAAGPLCVAAVRELQNARRAPATDEPFSERGLLGSAEVPRL